MFDDARYDGRMPYRRCGRSGVLMPVISLGFWHNFGALDDEGEARRLMHYAFDQGVVHFDLANNYGPPAGAAETLVGQILEKDFASHRDELFIATKAGHEMWPGPYGQKGSRKHLLTSLDQSLKRLGVDYVDVFYSHCPDDETPIEETVGALVAAVDSGRALYVGLSKYPLERLKCAVKLLSEAKVRCLVYQARYSLLEQQVEVDGILTWLENQGIGCVGFSPLAQGMLTAKYLHGLPSESRAARAEGFLKVEQVAAQERMIRSLDEVARNHGVSLYHLALAWTLRGSGVASSIVGARNVAQLKELLSVVRHLELPEAVWREVGRVVKELSP